MDRSDFVHLHVHSDYSLLDGACRVSDLVGLAHRHGMKSLALTDHGNLFGAVAFYRAMLDGGIKPIVGYEAYVAPGSRRDRHARGGIKDASHHVTILAADNEGYRNLIKMASSAYLEGFYYRPRIDLELLAAHKEGLIVLSGCNSSELCRNLLLGKEEEAERAAARYVDILGKENYFIEVQDNGLAEQKRCLEGLVRIAGKLGLELVATNDIHYGMPEDAAAHEVLLCINTGKMLADAGRVRFGSNEFYFKSGEEMIERLGHLPRAIENTRAIAERCHVEFDFNQRNFPHYHAPEGMDSAAYLRRLCEEGLVRRMGTPSKEAKARLKYELDIIERMGYSSYFLIAWDIVAFAKREGISTGLRGSGASSIVAYVLEISDIDPLKYDLIFERFLPPERREPPDLDIDVCEDRRDEVLRYVKERYGEGNTAQIITFGTMAARGVVRDVGRVLGWSVAEVDALAKRIPGGPGVTLRGALEQDEGLRKDYEGNERVQKLLKYAFKLEGLARHASTHAAGVVIADRPLTDYVPLCKYNDVVMSQFAMGDLERVGMLKLDLLGLRTLTIVDRTLDLVEERTGERPNFDVIGLDDARTYELLGRGDTKAVFQLGSSGIQELVRRLRPQNIKDIVAIVAMYRPGPLQSGMVDDYIARRHGEKEVTYLDPRLEPFLADTCGVIVYQEQIMRILNQLGRLSLTEALSTIKAIGKKKLHEIDKRSEAFMKGAKRNRLPEHVARELFDLIRKFAQYGFNRAHATAYAFLAYRTAYLKANYPMEFAAADLTCEMRFSEKLKDHIRDYRQHMGMEILPPCVNEGEAHFTVCGENRIRFGMAGVRNVGLKAVDAIVRARGAGGGFKSVHGFCERVESSAVNRQAIESLIKAGAFDGVPGHRAQKIAGLEDAMRAGSLTQRDRRRGQKSLFGEPAAGGELPEQLLPTVPEWPLSEVGRREKEALGMRLSFNPLDRYEEMISQLTTASAATLPERSPSDGLIIAGEVVAVRPTMTRHGRGMAHVEMEDLTGTFRAVAFPETFEKYGGLLKEDAIVFVVGVIDGNTDRPGVQIREVVSVEEAKEKLTGSVKLCFERAGLDVKILEGLRAVCGRHKGKRPVLLEITMPDRRRVLIRAGRGVAVRPTRAFGAEVAELVGEGHVKLVPRTLNGNGGENGWRREGGGRLRL